MSTIRIRFKPTVCEQERRECASFLDRLLDVVETGCDGIWEPVRQEGDDIVCRTVEDHERDDPGDDWRMFVPTSVLSPLGEYMAASIGGTVVGSAP
jgi:hypothetical protein